MDYMKINPYVRYARYDKGIMFKFPCVASDHRILLCLSDNAKLNIEDKIYTLKKDTVIMWKAGLKYCEVTEEEQMNYLGINFDYFYSEKNTKAIIPQIREKLFRHNMLIEDVNNGVIKEIPDCICIHSSGLKSIFEEVVFEYEKKMMYFEERCSALLKDIIISVMRTESNSRSSSSVSNADAILKYIHSHYMDDITNIFLAEKFSYHRAYIGQILKARTGMPLHKYLIYLRINKSIEYLQSGLYNITEVAELTGYKDIKHFSKSFKKVMGIAPSAYLIYKNDS
ncbi:MAG: helix-turn-helix transcriptional regulator [Ruminococcaceae bacterium]|nr:helix-turn-helix transcriptional regulator [Oscillospiraceae bacterium]